MILEAKSISFSYGETPFLKDISLSVQDGDFTMLAGPNGCGKSTLFKLLAGWLTPNAGEILFNGSSVSGLPVRLRSQKIAAVSQNPDVSLDFTVREMVAMGRFVHGGAFGLENAHDRAVIAECIRRMDLVPLQDRIISQLSGGERQRAVIAAALAQEPELLLLDEPTSAMDPANSVRLLELLKRSGMVSGCFIITHNLQLAARYAKKILLMKSGIIVREGIPNDVLSESVLSSVYACSAEVRQGKNSLLISFY